MGRTMLQPCVYIMTNRLRGTLYTGVTSQPVKRVYEHRESIMKGSFTHRYGIKKLIWYEVHETMETAISREKEIKGWNRDRKIVLIEKLNPHWSDLWPEINSSF